MDYYLWEFSPEKSDVWKSIGWSALMALLLMMSTSENVLSRITIPNKFVLGMVGRLRTYLLAWGVVNYWRAVVSFSFILYLLVLSAAVYCSTLSM